MIIAIKGTKSEIEWGYDVIEHSFGDQLRNVSEYYADEDGKTFRLYIDIDMSNLIGEDK
jgi:hypothetical protein